jgi:hypothetical protein
VLWLQDKKGTSSSFFSSLGKDLSRGLNTGDGGELGDHGHSCGIDADSGGVWQLAQHLPACELIPAALCYATSMADCSFAEPVALYAG